MKDVTTKNASSYTTLVFFFFTFFSKSFIYYLVLPALGLCCCAWAFSSCGERELLFVLVHRLLTASGLSVAKLGLLSSGSVAVVHRLSCSTACAIFQDQESNP